MAEWLRRGLQILAPEFDSRSGLHRDFQTDQTGAVIQPMTVAALTVAATIVMATATRALRLTKNRMLSNIINSPGPRHSATDRAVHQGIRRVNRGSVNALRLAREMMQGDGPRSRHIERIEAAGHRNANRLAALEQV